MVGICFSGTGNSKYAVELFCKEYDNESRTYSIEDTEGKVIKRVIKVLTWNNSISWNKEG